MNYTAIIKDGGLFIPNVFSELTDGQAHMVQIDIDIEAVREQLPEQINENIETFETPKSAVKAPKRQMQKLTKKALQEFDKEASRKNSADELAAFDDGELSDMLKAYMSNG